MAFVEVLEESGVQKQVLHLPEDQPFVIGRDSECDLSVVDSRISRRHAVVRKGKAGEYYAEDLGSKNGITVDGKRTKSSRLTSGDVVQLGPLRLRFFKEEPSLCRDEVLEAKTVKEVIDRGLDDEEAGRRLRLLLEISTIMDSFNSPEALLEKFGELIVQLFKPSCCLLRVCEELWGYDVVASVRGDTKTVSVSQSVVTRVSEHGEALLLHDVQDVPVVQIELGNRRETVMQRGRDLLDGGSRTTLGIRSVIGAPVLGSEGPMGVLYIDQRRVGAPLYCCEDVHLLIGVGRLLSAALSSSHRLERLEAESRLQRSAGTTAGMLVGESSAMAELRKTIETRIGPVRSSVLLIGETGTGKTVAAEAIHLASPRRGHPFVKVNCAAIPRELLESELFGHERGAFTGATQRRIGQFEAASGGTLFLDEVGELDPAAQAKLLSVVQDRSLTRVGGHAAIDIDVRLVAATNRDLKLEVSEGRFRADLYYRLNVVCLELPPLRERLEDLPNLAEHFLERACHETGRRIEGISARALALLSGYQWPGNLRELGNSIERAVIFSDGGEICPQHLPPEFNDAIELEAQIDSETIGEREMVLLALEKTGGNRRQAARLLGWYPQKLYARIKRYGLESVGRCDSC